MRRLLVALSVPTLFVIAAPPAAAGGSWLELREVDGVGEASDGPWGGWAAPGSTVHMAGDFCNGQQAEPSAGPWSAYLRPDPRGPERYLGGVTVADNPGNGCPFVASISFTVPQVDPGQYWVDVCNDPNCSTGVGDLIGGHFTVASTALEAKLLVDNASLRLKFSRAAKERNRLRARSADLDEAVRVTTDRLEAAEAERDRALGQRDAAIAARATLDESLEDARRAAAIWQAIALVVASALVVAVTVAIRRRRRVEDPLSPEAASPERTLDLSRAG
jgi:hypothetical protein